jgi:hypothetical protein
MRHFVAVEIFDIVFYEFIGVLYSQKGITKLHL